MMEQVKSFENIKENKPPADPHTQRVTVDIKHSHTLLNGFPEMRAHCLLLLFALYLKTLPLLETNDSFSSPCREFSLGVILHYKYVK